MRYFSHFLVFLALRWGVAFSYPQGLALEYEHSAEVTITLDQKPTPSDSLQLDHRSSTLNIRRSDNVKTPLDNSRRSEEERKSLKRREVSESRITTSETVVDGNGEASWSLQSESGPQAAVRNCTNSFGIREKCQGDKLEVHINATIPKSANASALTKKVMKVIEDSLQGNLSADVSRNKTDDQPVANITDAAAGQSNVGKQSLLHCLPGGAVKLARRSQQPTYKPTGNVTDCETPKQGQEGLGSGKQNDTVPTTPHISVTSGFFKPDNSTSLSINGTTSLTIPVPDHTQNQSGPAALPPTNITDNLLKQNSSLGPPVQPLVILPKAADEPNIQKQPTPTNNVQNSNLTKPQSEPASDLYKKPFGVVLLPKSKDPFDQSSGPVILVPNVGTPGDTTQNVSAPVVSGLHLPQNSSASVSPGSQVAQIGSTVPQNGNTVPQNGSAVPQDAGGALSQNGSSILQIGSAIPQNGSANSQNGSAIDPPMSETAHNGSTTVLSDSHSSQNLSATMCCNPESPNNSSSIASQNQTSSAPPSQSSPPENPTVDQTLMTPAIGATENITSRVLIPPPTPSTPTPTTTKKPGNIKIILPDHTELTDHSSASRMGPEHMSVYIGGIGFGLLLLSEFL
ncbi:hypothetical protein Pst134EA_005035 [Puccinia striiformis f. sp. tritici]|uniref:uncharacterized protein n=1 Tax=Puccinia striiformis f. sp. tritici TaxID=168172 RepID=UPI00200725DE|nr:uncharacterized protein Pst134EA_032375 [Puccinia striiformis f. sp. tritici]XP_047810580.1 hypothetical protein Pst134EA_005035 [Puccinia striiformis f. sp. tritici]KAH9441771.1 hypothetical protein Pst134EA_032375 [Puccinia striiformis f. sp. tritici]KAH9471126.1 hypothetical protein Pst134EA_005035 [Puccinia striiformis f. sp. tritici]